MKVALLDLRPQYQTIKSEIEPAVLSLMEGQQFVLGETVRRFEENIARYCQGGHAVGLSSGTDALLCGLMALGISRDDEVIVPSFTFFGTAGVVARLGAKPVFVDIDTDTFNIAADRIEPAITERTRAIIPVHLFGQMAPMSEILSLAERYDLKVIEDACQSIGSGQNGQHPGQRSEAACLSFYPSKNLAGFGDGGLLLCRDKELAQQCRYLRVHGEDQRYYHSIIGGNFRLDALQALVLDIKLRHLEGWVAQRRAHAARYDELLAGVVQTPKISPGNVSVYNQYVIRAPQRDELQKYLAQKQVGTAIYYPVPLHLQKCFAYLGGREGDCPAAEQVSQEVLALPVYPELSDEQIEYVANGIREFYQ